MKKRTRGSGLTAYEVASPETHDELMDGLRQLRSLDLKLADVTEDYRKLLEQAGFTGNLIPQRQAIIEKHGEESLPDLLADYIIHAEVMQAERTKLESNGGNAGGLIVAAAWCGQLRERIFWKRGIDYETKARIEDLALERRKARKAFQNDNEGRRAKNAARKAEMETWYTEARCIAANSKLSGGALEKRVRTELAKRGINKSQRSIRRALSGK